MKCDNLQRYSVDIDYVPNDDGAYMDADEVNEAIAELKQKLAEKDKEIALLKERICNGDVSRLIWIDDCFDKDEEITELKQKLENVQASMYADLVDANMENRRLKRALWKERADNASRIECMFRTLSDIEDDDTRTYWIFGNKWESVFYHLKCHRMKTAYDWTMIWENVECKCREKVEEYR